MSLVLLGALFAVEDSVVRTKELRDGTHTIKVSTTSAGQLKRARGLCLPADLASRLRIATARTHQLMRLIPTKYRQSCMEDLTMATKRLCSSIRWFTATGNPVELTSIRSRTQRRRRTRSSILRSLSTPQPNR